MSSVLTPWLPIYPCVHAIRCPFLYIFHSEKNLNLFATNGCNKMCVCVRLLEWLHWWHNFLCYLLEKRYVVFITSWHCSLGGNFLADTIRYLSWPALSRSWHLAASGMGLRVMSHQAGLLTTLHHIHICFPEQGGNMVTTMGWGFSDFRQLFCFPLLINKACMYHNHIPLMYIFDSPANECWVSYSFNTNWALGFIFEWNCDQSNFYSRKSIGNVVCKTEAILSRSQWVNNDNVAHSSHSGLNINGGGLWTVAI